ncbi:short-chain dehydrogenase [Denitratisoma sp. DHT3]|uniref:SDR family NAD(P)-dependent oxidoreductase n=1 Tax=Denitratisoma sp. DHT3 TaxID=1981880 RepID=UPI0011989662|nr:SDR family NAD(P)-dependent oxidoreductase [Denitratisoma sp. DHT3]QDX81728.1 short-chain dehydrogenase [Denitratisoma sp. DHT3]
MPDILKDKVAIVTGASRGIGAGIALRLAAEGAKVVITARTLEADGKLPGSLNETAARIRALGGECLCVQANLADPEDRARIVPAAIERFGGVDILVNNAAAAHYRPTREQKPRHTHLGFEINFFAPLELSQQAIPSMAQRGGGWILNISSATSRAPDPAPYDPQNRYLQFHVHVGPTLYAASKSALERLSAGMAAELAADRIAVNTLAPVEAVASEGALATGAIDAVAHMEPVEAMAEAALQLCSRPQSQLSGRCVLSLDLLRELGIHTVKTLDGARTLPDYSF